MFRIRFLFSIMLISLQLGTVHPAVLHSTYGLLPMAAADLFPMKIFTINRFIENGCLPTGPLAPIGTSTPALTGTPTPALTGTPTVTGSPSAPTNPSPTPTPKPVGPTPLPIGDSQAIEAGDLSFDYPEAAPVNTDTTTYTLLVNKEHTLDSKYIPFMVVPNVEIYHKGTNERRYLQPIAAASLEEMFDAAKKDGLQIVLRCGFRSYPLQRSIYIYALKTYGYYEASRFHALPGTSEHQTGLAIDICCKATKYENNFDILKTKEYKWMLENAHKYGWILRYPENKESITGYNFEPWHFRYVGVELAIYLKELDITLEEYYGAPSTTHLQGVPKEYWSYLSAAEYEFMLASVAAYEQDPSGKTQPTPSPRPTATPKLTGTPIPSDTPELSGTPIPSGTPELSGTPIPSDIPELSGTPTPSGTPKLSGTPTPTVAPDMDEPVPTPDMLPTPTPVP